MNKIINQKNEASSLSPLIRHWIKHWTELLTKLSTELWLSLLTRAFIWALSRAFIWLWLSISSILHPGFIRVQISRIETFFLSLSWLTAFSLWRQSSFLVRSIKAHQGMMGVVPLLYQSLAVQSLNGALNVWLDFSDIDVMSCSSLRLLGFMMWASWCRLLGVDFSM